MKRLVLASLLLCATPAAAQQTVSPPPVVAGPNVQPYVPDEAGTGRYVADFARLCLDTGGEPGAVRAAATQAGWTPGQGTPEMAAAVELAVFDSPDGYGGQLLTSASLLGELDGGLIVRTCILQPHQGTAGPRARLEQAVTAAIGLPGRPQGQGLAWLLSGTLASGFKDESKAFIAAGSTDAGFALALERPLLMVTLLGSPEESGLALMRVSPE